MKRYVALLCDEAMQSTGYLEEDPGWWVGKWEEANTRVAELEASLEAADRAGLELAKQLETAERKVERCKAVLSRRFTEAGHCPDPNGELCSADELEAALEDK